MGPFVIEYKVPIISLHMQVGFINFSKHYMDYENPLKVTNSSSVLFTAVAPVDALVNQRTFDRVLPLVSLFSYVEHQLLPLY